MQAARESAMLTTHPRSPLSTVGRRLRAVALTGVIVGLVGGTAGCRNADPLGDAPVPRVGLLSLQDESEHFAFFGVDEERPTLAVMAETLEGERDLILEHLEADVPFKVQVEVYPDLSSFHAAAGFPNPQDWFIGQIAGSSTIRIVSPRNPGPVHTYASVMRGVVHEFVHIVTTHVNAATASRSWLSEGTALYEARQTPSREKVRAIVASGTVPRLAQLSSYVDFVAHDGYTFSYTIAEYIVSRHGRPALAQLIRAPFAVEAALGPGLDEAGLERAWHAFLSETYK